VAVAAHNDVLAIVASLGDVPRHSRRDHAGFAGHRLNFDCRTAGELRTFPRIVRRPIARYSENMKVAFDLPEAQAEKLRREAERLGIPPSDLARAALTDLLAARDKDFQAAAERVLSKNEDLYRRLA
jgi:hypothetical protein